MATRGVVCSYEEVIDLSTEPEHVTVIGIHTPTGDTPRKLFRGFYDQYKKFKYLGASVSLVPAARLPADLLQVSYEGGDVIDPRDALNPLMFHGCHGDDMGVILNRLYGNNDVISDSLDGIDAAYSTPDGSAQTGLNDLEYDQLERLYYKALTDNTWKKAHPQRGFRKSGLHPLIYQVATNRQLLPGSTVDAFFDGVNGDPESPQIVADGSPAYTFGLKAGVQKNTQFFTPKLTSLGWMDTCNVITEAVRVGEDDAAADIVTAGNLQAITQSQINYAELPKLYMGVILMSASYKVKSYYRMIINHRFAFKDFRGISFMPEVSDVPSYFNANEDGIFNADTFDPIDPLEGE